MTALGVGGYLYGEVPTCGENGPRAWLFMDHPASTTSGLCRGSGTGG